MNIPLRCDCGALFSADDVHVSVGIANCRVCRAALDLFARAPLSRPRPPRFTTRERDGKLIVRMRRLRGEDVLALVIAAAILSLMKLGGWFIAFGLAFPVLNVLGRVSRIVVDDSGIRVGRRRFARAELTQLYCRRDGLEREVRYTLAAVVKDGSRWDVVGGFDTLDEAAWLEETLEARLGIPARPVEGDAYHSPRK